MAKKTPKKQKSPRGRKPRAAAAGKGVTVLISDEEREAYRAAADAADLSLAEWIRQACAEHLKRG